MINRKISITEFRNDPKGILAEIDIEPIGITQFNTIVAVMVSPDEYNELKNAQDRVPVPRA